MRTRLQAALPYIAVAATIIGFVNFFWFFAESVSLGGDAINGYQRDGHYFLGNKGSYTEVTKSVWEWSRIHAESVWITHPLALLGMAYLIIGHGFPLFMGGSARADMTGRAADVRMSGPELASTRCAGAIGLVQFSGRFLRVAVHPSGILIKPPFMPQRAILAPEISNVSFKRRFLSKRLVVEHSGVDSASPLELFVGEASAVALSIERLRDGGSTARSDHSVEIHTTPPKPPDRIETILRAQGVAVGLAMVAIGVLWAIPQIGAPGVIWTALSIAITAVNVRRWVLAARR